MRFVVCPLCDSFGGLILFSKPVPPDMARLVDIICNDCEERSLNQRVSVLECACLSCTLFVLTHHLH